MVVLCAIVRRGWPALLMFALCEQPGASLAADIDPFGVTMLNPTATDGRKWFARWDEPRTIDGFGFDPADPLFRNSDGKLTIGGGIASEPSATTRLYVMTPSKGRPPHVEYTAPQWKNVEMTIYARIGEPTGEVSGRSLALAARSGEHNERDRCDGTSYYATLRFDGTCGFKKEIWHADGAVGYTDLRPTPAPRLWETIPRGRWIGMKFVCRSYDADKHVCLELHLDDQDQNQWRQVAGCVDDGGWEAQHAGCDRPRDFIITDARPSVYFRTDQVPLEVRKFSVREIEARP